MKSIKKTIINVTTILLVFACMVGLTSCSCAKQTPVTKNGFYLDTIITITLYEDNASELIDECFNIAEKYDNMLSRTKEGSDVYKINHAGNEAVEVNPDTVELISQAINYGQLSDGAFDITLGKLTTLWDFSNRTSVPTTNEINACLGFNYNNIELNGNSVRLKTDKEMLDLGGIAKGFIADKIKEYLTSKGVKQGIINLGGNILCLDKKNNTDTYKIGIQKPFDESGAVICSLNMANKSVVTSGDYQRYFIENGHIYHHILDVNTGYPVDNELDSVTIINGSSTAGDALSTISFIYGLDKGMQFIEGLPDTEAIFVTKDGTIHKTSGIDDKMINYKEE